MIPLPRQAGLQRSILCGSKAFAFSRGPNFHIRFVRYTVLRETDASLTVLVLILVEARKEK